MPEKEPIDLKKRIHPKKLSEIHTRFKKLLWNWRTKEKYRDKKARLDGIENSLVSFFNPAIPEDEVANKMRSYKPHFEDELRDIDPSITDQDINKIARYNLFGILAELIKDDRIRLDISDIDKAWDSDSEYMKNVFMPRYRLVFATLGDYSLLNKLHKITAPFLKQRLRAEGDIEGRASKGSDKYGAGHQSLKSNITAYLTQKSDIIKQTTLNEIQNTFIPLFRDEMLVEKLGYTKNEAERIIPFYLHSSILSLIKQKRLDISGQKVEEAIIKFFKPTEFTRACAKFRDIIDKGQKEDKRLKLFQTDFEGKLINALIGIPKYKERATEQICGTYFPFFKKLIKEHVSKKFSEKDMKMLLYLHTMRTLKKMKRKGAIKGRIAKGSALSGLATDLITKY
jgi:hypothetical protein